MIFEILLTGIADYQLRRSPNATVGFVDGKTKYRFNHTEEWIENLEPEEQKSKIDFAVREGAKHRAKSSK